MKRVITAAALVLTLLTACGTVGRSALSPTTPSDLNECSDHYAKCRDRCVPAEVEESACFRDHEGRIHRVCTCKSSGNDFTVREPTQNQKPSYPLGGGLIFCPADDE